MSLKHRVYSVHDIDVEKDLALVSYIDPVEKDLGKLTLKASALAKFHIGQDDAFCHILNENRAVKDEYRKMEMDEIRLKLFGNYRYS